MHANTMSDSILFFVKRQLNSKFNIFSTQKRDLNLRQKIHSTKIEISEEKISFETKKTKNFYAN